MNEQQQQRRNQMIILLIAAMSAIPFGIAWLMKNNPNIIPRESTNNGLLITPIITTERSDLQGFDDFSIEHLKELNGHWVIMNIVPKNTCNKLCQDAIFKTKQLRLMMNKDLVRIRRAVLLMGKMDVNTWCPPKKNSNIKAGCWENDSRLLHIIPSQTMKQNVITISNGKAIEGMLIIMDPLGNLMMQYESGFDPYKVKADLKKLLRISQIG